MNALSFCFRCGNAPGARRCRALAFPSRTCRGQMHRHADGNAEASGARETRMAPSNRERVGWVLEALRSGRFTQEASGQATPIPLARKTRHGSTTSSPIQDKRTTSRNLSPTSLSGCSV